MRNRLGLIVIGTTLSILPPLAARQQSSQAPTAGQAGRAARAASDEGIPVTDPEVRRACGSCHTTDDKNRMTRISYRRATPENWELTIRRMISLNHVTLTPEVARALLTFDFSEADHVRMAELARKSNEGSLDADERREFESYVFVGDVLALMKSKALATLAACHTSSSVAPGRP